MTARLSIVMPLFNKSAYVAAALQALLPQLKAGDEIIVVDDCSTDEGPAIAQRLLDGTPGAQVLRMAGNAGPASARNTGARASSGSHLLFFDADDVPAPTLLDALRDTIARFPNDAVFAYRIAFQARGETWTKLDPGMLTVAERRPKHAFAHDSVHGRTLCTASSTCVARQAFMEVGGFQEGLRYCEDPELWARLSARHDIIAISDVLALYRDVPQSLSYGLRGHIGAVNPYVDSLLNLGRSYDEAYQPLARSLLLKNLVFARAAGVSRREAATQLRAYRGTLGPLRHLALQAFAVVPSRLVSGLLAWRGRRRQNEAAMLVQGSSKQ